VGTNPAFIRMWNGVPMAAMRLAALAACAALLVAGCSTAVEGQAVSSLYDPFKVGGLPATDGPSGVRDDAPEPEGTAENTDGGEMDRLAVLSVNDIQEFWEAEYDKTLTGEFKPIEDLVSYNSESRSSPAVCGVDTYDMPNAFFCRPDWLMAWDRDVMLPTGVKYFGDMSVNAVIAHEYGHAIQQMADLISGAPGIVVEQQADCFAGVYQRWVAEGESPRFTLSTADGLNHVLAGTIVIRDPVIEEGGREDLVEEGHGTALDRVSAFQMGFVTGATACEGIDLDEVEERRGDLPIELKEDPDTGDVQTGELEVNEQSLDSLMDVLGKVFTPSKPPTLDLEAAECPDAQPSPPASYCPSTNTINVDLPALQELGKKADEDNNRVLLQGDNTAFSIVTSRYAMAVENEKGVALDSAQAAMRTACLTGVAQREMANPDGPSGLTELPSGGGMQITAGDLDEAVSGLLTNGVVASDVNGSTVPAGFTRIVAFRSGLTGDAKGCFNRFK
jgi:predicted metalloprotease